MYNARELVILRAKLAKAEDLVELIAAAKNHLCKDGFSDQINKIILWEQEREWNHIVDGLSYDAIDQAIEKSQESVSTEDPVSPLSCLSSTSCRRMLWSLLTMEN